MTAPIPYDQLPVHDPATCARIPCGKCGPRRRPQSPPARANPHDHQRTTTDPDPTVKAMGLPRHPAPSTIADTLEDAAKKVRQIGLQAIDMASTLAARGYSTRTLSDGGPRSSDTTSRTERLAANPDRWDAADATYAQILRNTWLTAMQAHALTVELLRHASDVDPTPAGTGGCRACSRFVRPTKDRSSFRLRSGLCPSCFGAWSKYTRAGGPQLWSEWTAKRRETLTERDEHGNAIRVHTPDDNPAGDQ